MKTQTQTQTQTQTKVKLKLNGGSNLSPMQVWLFNNGLEGVVVARTQFGAKQIVVESLLEELGVNRAYAKHLVEKLECRGVGVVYKNAGLSVIASFYNKAQIVCTLEPNGSPTEEDA